MKGLSYVFFALFATIVNLLTQELCFLTLPQVLSPYMIYISMVAGTLTGMVLKYFLDQRYIFVEKKKDFKHSSAFIKYGLVSVLTTCIFWVFEWGFYQAFDQSKLMTYTGAVIGLALGYLLKYRLDQKFVF